MPIAALDCEMVYTTAGLSIARLTLVDAEGKVILDEYLIPNGLVVDYVTRWSGIREGDLAKAKWNLADFQQNVLGDYIDGNTSEHVFPYFIDDEFDGAPPQVLIGHGLENDLKALRLVPRIGQVIDTAALYPHPRGLPYRYSLKILTKEHLMQCERDHKMQRQTS